MVREWSWWIVVLCFAHHTAQGQFTVVEPVIYPEKIHEDLAHVHEVLLAVHPEPYRYLDSSEFAVRFRALKDSIRVPMSAERFSQMLTGTLALLGDRSCYSDVPSASVEALRKHASALPVQVRILGSGMYVEDELKGFRSLPRGARILSVNGIPADTIISRIGSLYATDGANRTFRLRRVEQELPWALRRSFGPRTSYTIHYQGPDGVEGEEVLFAMSGTEMDRSRKPMGHALLPWRAGLEPEGNALWVTLRSFDVDTLEVAGQRSDRFLKAMLKEARKSKAATLVVDLRGADGEDMDLVRQLFSAIAKEPFHTVRSVNCTGLGASSLLPTEGTPLVRSVWHQRLSAPLNGLRSLPPSDPLLFAAEPMPAAFDGPVYVVCDGLTRGAASAFAALVTHYQRGRVVGEETASNADRFNVAELVYTLQNTQVRVHVPQIQIALPYTNNGAQDRGVLPDHAVEQLPADVAKGKDTVRSALLELLREIH